MRSRPASRAQPPRHPRSSTAAPEVGSDPRTAAAREPARAEPPRPTITADQVLAIHQQTGAIREQQLVLMRRLIAETPDDKADERVRLRGRLAGMHGVAFRNTRLQAMQVVEHLDRARNPAERARLQRVRRERIALARKHLRAALEQYRAAFAEPAARNLDDAPAMLMHYGYLLGETGRDVEARRVFQRVIKDYPSSPHVAEALLVFGDHYFAAGALAKAERIYDKILRLGHSRVHHYAQFKKAWVLVNLGRHQEALEGFYQVLEGTASEAALAHLRDAARRDFVRQYAEVGKPERARAMFRRIDADRAEAMLETLADIYLDAGATAKAVYVYRALIAASPEHERVCQWQHHVALAVLGGGTAEQQAAEVDRLAQLYGHLARRGRHPRDVLAECRSGAETLTRQLAFAWHEEASKLRSRERLAAALTLYARHADHFEDGSGQVGFYHAEARWLDAEWETRPRRAGAAWERAARAFGAALAHPTLPRARQREASHAAALAWLNALRIDPGRDALPALPEASDTLPAARPLSERQKALLAAIEAFVARAPKAAPEALELRFYHARVLLAQRHFERAIAGLEPIVRHHLASEYGPPAVTGLIDALVLTRQEDELIAIVERLLADDRFTAENETLAGRLRGIGRIAQRRRVEAIERRAEARGDLAGFVDCGRAYLELYNRDTSAEDGPEVLYNAGVCFERGASLGAANTVLQGLVASFPESPHAQRALARLGRNYARVARYDRAAATLRAYARRFGGEEDAAEALSEAVFYWKGIGADDDALADTRLFVSRYADRHPARAADALFGATAILEKRVAQRSGRARERARRELIEHLERYLRQLGDAGGAERRVIAEAKLGMALWRAACPIEGTEGACIRTTRARSVAHSRQTSRRTQCGDATKTRIELVPRDRALVRRAHRALTRAEAAYRRVDAAARTPQLVHFFAAARFTRAEADYESFLALAFPTDLDFDPSRPRALAAARKRFAAWTERKDALGASAARRYRDVMGITGGGADWAIASAARIGQLSQHLASALFTAPIPRQVRSGKWAEDKIDRYCVALEEVAIPHEDRAVAAFGVCLSTSTQLGWFNDWSRLCERELGQIDPNRFPTARELHAAASATHRHGSLEAPVLRLPRDP